MFFSVIRILLITACCTAAGASSMHMLQAQRYDISGLRRQMRHFGDRLLRPDILIALITAVVNWYLPILLAMAIQKEEFRETLCGWIVLVLFTGVVALVCVQKRSIPQKKEFAVTRRICRLMGMVILLNLLGTLLLTLLSLSPYFMFAGVDYVVLLAALMMRPVEDRINASFFNAAHEKLAAREDLIRIGITGSYGKTDTKMILRGILSEKFRVLATPASFSTAMGISRVVNEQLTKAHQIFIAEMGAQHKGDIRELVRLVGPHYGVLTSIGNAHLDTFGSIENAAQTKFELVQGLPENGAAFFGSDGSYNDRLYALCKTEKYRAGIGDEVFCDLYARGIEMNERGMSFELHDAEGKQLRMQTRLLGHYNVRNIALAACVARKLDMTLEEIADGVQKLQPVKHHLQLIDGKIFTIDDSANNLPEAGTEALRVLSEFPGRRILVTAGFIDDEGGLDDQNFAFGTQISGCADYVILVGPEQTRPIVRGLMSARYPKSALRIVDQAEDALTLVREIAEDGDSILYEGILPNDEE